MVNRGAACCHNAGSFIFSSESVGKFNFVRKFDYRVQLPPVNRSLGGFLNLSRMLAGLIAVLMRTSDRHLAATEQRCNLAALPEADTLLPSRCWVPVVGALAA
ncbi:hypothetical protein [Scytonema sp. HK-05]|uniref:hypothetical protein n=1 Tax=Scytonema sp. HK-05 TaxID=1137095 RepID=UPI000937D5E3|nr:hypothetical protein NIES2130_17750 [Scytonema sp. HK-05]